MSASITMAKAGRRPTPGRPGQMRGDPGLLGGLVGAVGGFLTGGPAGAVAGGIAGYKGSSPSPPRSSFAPQSLPVLPTPGLGGAVQRMLPGGKTGYEVAAPAAGKVSGYHLNKSGYFLKSGEYVAPGTRWVKNRRRNPLNPRALSRAISRLESGKKAAKKLSSITIRKPSCSRR